jgi:hypothetical protein
LTETAKNAYLKNHYNISLEDYLRLFEKQKERCAGCKRHQSDLEKALAVDHCHETRKVRGLLCSMCNLGLGTLNDDSQILRRLAKYLDKYNK